MTHTFIPQNMMNKQKKDIIYKGFDTCISAIPDNPDENKVKTTNKLND